MADAHAKDHDYHIIDPSPWPVLGSLGALTMALGGIFWMHYDMVAVFVVGTLLVLYTMYGWWSDVVNEGEHKGDHTPVVQLGLRYGMFMFIISEVMFFFAWFWSYFNASIFPTEAIGSVWPPEGVATLDPWHLPLINTLILLLSGTTVTWAHHALQEGNRKGFIQGLVLTILLGASFTGIQIYEYGHATFGFADGIYSSTFYMATGFHGAHVLIGTIFLAICLIRGLKGHFKPDHHFGFEAAAWYWHFVDVVWLFLFVSIYVLGAGDAAGVAH
ncbi:MAG: cytochrome c oxidase subunit 3 [Kordiimonas sp.]|nr:cytochrome c oxidase subunit 3 [Kordiimonas sp.]|tara:strand:+ start:448 stop:1266 length:819 start_codon:yes stop_codon:yes gene_type:complete